MKGKIRVVFGKEFLEMRRDRKTLLVTFLLPCIAFPLLISGLINYQDSLVRKRALRMVTIAADAQTRADYPRLVHDYFFDSDVGKTFQSLQSPLARMLGLAAPPGPVATRMPPEAVADPEALRRWGHAIALDTARSLAKANRDYIHSRLSAEPIPQALIEQAQTFSQTIVQGLGQISFVDPSALPEPPASFTDEKIPKEIRPLPDARRLAWAIERRKIQGYVKLPPGLDSVTTSDSQRTEVTLIYDSTIPLSQEAQGRVRRVVELWRDRYVNARLARHDLSRNFAHPVELKREMNLASDSKQILTVIAGMVPYLVIVFAFMGGMATATDVGAGEKERGSLETLLLTPATRSQLALGKFLIIMLSSFLAGLLSIASLGLSLALIVPYSAFANFDVQVDPMHIFMIGTLALPAAATIAGMLLALSIYARSAKEAQSYMAPLTFLLLIPGMAAMLPDVEPGIGLSFIPLVNVSVLMREFMKGEAWWGCYTIAMISSLVYAAVFVAIAVRMFGKEEVLFRA